MTISYSGNFVKLLVRWKGSIWKSVWKELLGFLTLYYAIRAVYRLCLDEQSQYVAAGRAVGADGRRLVFERAAIMFDNYTRFMPVTFLLGFYIASIVQRWWSQFEWVAWPDDLLSLLCVVVPGDTLDARLRRRTAARHLNLTAALAWRDVSVKVRKRFPTVDHLVSAGLMTEQEKQLFYQVQVETVRWFLPLQWVQGMVQDLALDNKVPPPIASAFFSELRNYRTCFRKLYCYDWVCIPLVYTQVAALVTYGYFGFCLIGRQFLRPHLEYQYKEVDLYVPIFTIIQFLFYVGWFKVGQDLMRPFGTDDDDIELNYILDRHIRASFALVDGVSAQRPDLVADRWLDADAVRLPHTKLSAKMHEHPPKLHAFVRLRRPDDADVQTPRAAESPLIARQAKKHWRDF